MNEIKNGINHAINFMEQNNRGVQLGCYSVSLVGLSIAIRKVRPFSKFRKPSDIPNHFIKERKELTGLVERIEPNGALLMVRHKPLLALPGLPGGQLPVKISGVNVSRLGVHWMQAIIAGSEVKFIPVVKEADFVQCQVFLPQLKNNKQKIINVGESLVRVGFGEVAEVEKPISSDRMHLSYFHRLQVAERYARRKELGIKYYTDPFTSSAASIIAHFKELFLSTYRQILLIPKMSTP